MYAVCDVGQDLATRRAVTHGAKKTYPDYEGMLADPELDAVVIATSDVFHVPAAKIALQAVKHVLCEKPIGVSVEEVEDLADVVQTSGRRHQVGI